MRRHLTALLLCCCYGSAGAADIGVVGVTHDKAILSIDGGSPRGYVIGSMLDDSTRLVAVDGEGVTIEVNKKRYQIPLGQAGSQAFKTSSSPVILTAGASGHYVANTQINGVSLRMLVDTGATLVILGAREAVRMGINYRNGQRSQMHTANGITTSFLVKLDTVRLGNIELHQVEAAVIENNTLPALLGMSFLKRMNIRLEDGNMILTQRY